LYRLQPEIDRARQVGTARIPAEAGTTNAMRPELKQSSWLAGRDVGTRVTTHTIRTGSGPPPARGKENPETAGFSQKRRESSDRQPRQCYVFKTFQTAQILCLRTQQGKTWTKK
jgi:hypothetical protein